MSDCGNVTRRTSEDTYVEYEPCGVLASPHVAHLVIAPDGTPSGTFKLWLNGVITGAITYNATPATLVTNIQTALDAAQNPDAFTVSNSGDIMILTADAVGYWKIKIIWEDTMTNVVDFYVDTITQGTQLFPLTGEVSKFNYQGSNNLIDVTALNEKDVWEITGNRSMTWELTVFEADQTWAHILFEDAQGVFTVYKTGKLPGSKYFSFRGLVDSYGEQFTQGEKLEITVSGVRQGKMLIPFESIYTG